MEQVREQEQGPATSAEEAADFARVGAMVGAGEPAPGEVVPEQEQAQPTMDAAESLTGLLSLVGTGASMAGLEKVAAVWSPQACEQLAGATVPVLRKYPWGARILAFLESGTGAEEAVLVVAVLGMGKATLDAYKEDMEKPQEAAPPPQRLPVVPTRTTDAPQDLGGLVEVHGHAG